MHQLSSSFVLGYHGCDADVGERLLDGHPFQPSDNDFDWLGPGVYFWEANPERAIEFSVEVSKRTGNRISRPYVVGAILDLRICLDLTTKDSQRALKAAHQNLAQDFDTGGYALPSNGPEPWRRNLDCAVIRRLHGLREAAGSAGADTVKGAFIEGEPLYEGSAFRSKTHIQIAVRNLDCIKGVFRVPYPNRPRKRSRAK